MSTFKIGDVVLCINDDFSNVPIENLLTHTHPVAGTIYTVRDVLRLKQESIWLNEIYNGITFYSIEVSFFSWRFVKLIDAENLANEYVTEDELLPVEGKKMVAEELSSSSA